MRPPPRPLTRFVLAAATVLFLVNARGRAAGHPSPYTDPPRDAFTFSEPAKVAVRHLSLDLSVDFERRRLTGSATLDVVNRTGTDRLVLDTQGLVISGVTRDGLPAAYTLGQATDLGAPLTIDIEPGTRQVRIEYATGPNAPGLYWVTAAQTYGRAMPFLYTQNEPIGARGWIPIQDTPAARMTYDATIRVPAGHLAIMSAGDNARQVNTGGVYSVRMEQTIPAYLIALAAGRLEYHAFDERTGVYAEPELIDAAASELGYMPEMLAAAERILGPHPFPRHDLLLAPPTYVVGGMEHPMLNFINPFGGVSGNSPPRVEPRLLLAHELAHSWAGDATTLGSWSDVWLNEGITSYLTLRILEEMGYRERSEYQWLADRENYAWYAQEIKDSDPTLLHRELAHPNEGFGFTPYTKGALFLRTLEDLLGRTTLDRFLRDYFRSFSFRWVDDRNFVARLAASLGGTIDATLRVNEWIYGTRLPSNVSGPASSALRDRVQARIAAFNGGAAVSTLEPQAWTDLELDLFLGSLPSMMPSSRLAEIDAAFGLSFRQYPPTSWLRHVITGGYGPGQAGLERVLMRGGANGTIATLYSWLIPVNKARAQQLFDSAKDRYHPNVVAQIQRMLDQAQSNAA